MFPKAKNIDTTVTVFLPDEDGEIQEVECHIHGGFYPATWGYDGGSPAEVPEVDFEAPPGMDEAQIVEEAFRALQSDWESYEADRYDEYYDEDLYDPYDDTEDYYY